MIKLKDILNEILSEMPQITKQGKTIMAGEKPLRSLGVPEVRDNLVFIRQQQKGGFIPEGWTLVYFMDSEESAKEMATGNIPYLLVPVGTFYSGGSPITDVWKKKFQKPGHEHILGILQGNTSEDIIFIDMLTVRPGYQRNTIASKMVDLIKKAYPNAKITHSDPTDKGESFLKKRGELDKKYLDLSEGELKRNILDNLTKILNFHAEMNGIKILKARSMKDEFGGYVWDFWLSEPLPSYEIDSIKNELKDKNPFISQHTFKDGQVKLRILVS